MIEVWLFKSFENLDGKGKPGRMLAALSRIGSAFGIGREKPTPQVSLAEACVPDGHRAYVMGDIHGRADLLKGVLAKIETDLRTAPFNTHLVYLGDYVDRGHQSREVIDLIVDFSPPQVNVVTIAGNHEEAMLGFLEDPVGMSDWLKYGGDATVHSYGIAVPPGVLTRAKIMAIAEALEANLPREHRLFLESLDDWFQLGDYMFVHAGIDPTRSLDRQNPQQTRWMREPFLSHPRPYDKVVVHGHTITDGPEFRDNRISLDTGAYYSGLLTCVVLEGASRRVL